MAQTTLSPTRVQRRFSTPGCRSLFPHLPRSMRGALGVVLASSGVVAFAGSTQAQTVVQWTFETSQPAGTANGTTSYAPENKPNYPSTATYPNAAAPLATVLTTGLSSGGHGTVSSPLGNGSTHSFNATAWALNNYFQFTLSTDGLTKPLNISYDQLSSGTGPRDFQLQYSIDGGTFMTTTDAPGYSLAAGTFSSGVSDPSFNHSFILTNTALDNYDSVVFRIVDTSTTAINGNTVGSTGTDRIDNFTVTEVPEPTTIFGAALLLVATAWSQRRRLSGWSASSLR